MDTEEEKKCLFCALCALLSYFAKCASLYKAWFILLYLSHHNYHKMFWYVFLLLLPIIFVEGFFGQPGLALMLLIEMRDNASFFLKILTEQKTILHFDIRLSDSACLHRN